MSLNVRNLRFFFKVMKIQVLVFTRRNKPEDHYFDAINQSWLVIYVTN